MNGHVGSQRSIAWFENAASRASTCAVNDLSLPLPLSAVKLCDPCFASRGHLGDGREILWRELAMNARLDAQ